LYRITLCGQTALAAAAGLKASVSLVFALAAALLLAFSA
jgi:hypothetical protein